MYSKKVMCLFKNPKHMGKMKNPDGVGTVGNPNCGDVMKVYIKVSKNKKNKEILKDVKVETFGCVAAISTSSQLTDMVIGKTIKEALKVSKKDVTDALGGLPLEKWHCSVLAVDALKSAVDDYRKK